MTKAQLLIVMAISIAGVPAEAALSNEQFAAQVKMLRAKFASDLQAVEEAKQLCANLPPKRAMDEPKCVALSGHLGATATKSPNGVPRF